MTFETSPELRLFAESVRGALVGWEAPREPTFGTWWDEHDDTLAARLAALGWSGLWEDGDLLAAAVAGGLELGRILAPQSLLDAATLGGSLAVAGRVRHLSASHCAARVTPGGGLVIEAVGEGEPEPTMDGTGTMRIEPPHAAAVADSAARLRAWGVATLAYLAGLADASLEATVAYVTSREQFGAPLAALPTMQARLADAAVAVDGLELVAWEAAARDPGEEPLAPVLTWAGATAREVTAIAHQAHGGVGFALESGVHRAYRRAKSAQVWIAAVLETAAV